MTIAPRGYLIYRYVKVKWTAQVKTAQAVQLDISDECAHVATTGLKSDTLTVWPYTQFVCVCERESIWKHIIQYHMFPV